MKVLNALSRDDTEHGVYYYLASAVDAELAKKDAEIAGLRQANSDLADAAIVPDHLVLINRDDFDALTAERDAWIKENSPNGWIGQLRTERDALAVDYLLREKAEAERDALAKDAARYKALRDSGYLPPEQFDAQVDAALEAALVAFTQTDVSHKSPGNTR